MPGTLHYFDIHGRGDPIRALLCHAGVSFTDHRIPMEDFKSGAAEPFTVLGAFPVWEEDGIKMPSSNSILRFLGIRHGYYPEDPMCAYEVDSLMDFMEDLYPVHRKYIMPMFMGQPITGGHEEVMKNCYCRIFDAIETRMNTHGKKFVAGTDRPTIADFKLFAPLCSLGKLNPMSAYPEECKEMMAQKAHEKPGVMRWIMTMKEELATHLA